MHCETQIAVDDLIPIVGYILTKGRCRHCGGRIGLDTLAGEVLPGILLPLQLFAGFNWPAALFGTLLAGQLYISMATDWKFFLLDHENAAFLFLWAAAGAAFKSGFDWDTMKIHALTAAGSGAIFLLLFFAAKMRGLGFGDVLLAAILSLFLSLPWSLILFQSAAAFSIVFIYLKKDRKAPAPLGFFMAPGFYLAILCECGWRIYSGLSILNVP